MGHVLFRTLTALLAGSMLVAACGDDDDVDTGAESTSETTSESTSTTTDGEDDTTTTTTDGEDDTTTTGSSEPCAIEGERIEIFPYEDAELGVVGVEADDTLNVRNGPGVGCEVRFELDPLATGVIATGHNRSLDGSGIWAEITSDGQRGWANVRFLSHLGRTDDITTEIAPTPSDRPTAETMLRLGRMIGEMRGSEEPRSDIVVVDGPVVGDLGEITVDVIGLGDDAQGGERLHIFAEPGPGGESFTMRSVERTLLCTRGVSDGLCV